MIELLNKLDRFRESKGVTKKELAKAADISAAYYSQLLSGDRSGLTVLQLAKMADYLGLQLNFVLK
jgi:transcriptional regulator with XRE-family HTH domain